MIYKCYRCDEVISMCPCDESTYTADDEISRLRAELAVARAELAVSVGHLSRLAEAYGCEDFTAAVDAAIAAKGE